MTGLRHLKLTLTLVALVMALAIVAEARADVTSAVPADTGTTPTTVTAPAPVPTDPAPVSTDPAPVPTPHAPVSTDPAPAPTAPAPVPTPPAPPAPGSSPVSTGTPPGSSSDPAPPDQGPSPPTGDDQPTTTADGPSTSTSQTIVQVQTSGCLANCQGTNQTQVAQQQNLTVQTVPPATPPGSPTDQSISDSQPQGSANVTQIQVGCIHDCSGTSVDTTAPPISPATLSQLLALLGSSPLASQPDAPGAQAGVGQSSLQTQQGGDDQSQAASQWSTTVQDLVSQAVDGAVQAVNQATQTIIQVQIGCLFYCADTHQTQQASQTNTSVQLVSQGVTAATAAVATAVNTVNQFVLQIQIGCLAYCSDTTQEQSASQSNEVVVTTAPQASGPPPAPANPVPAPSDTAPGPSDPGPGPAPANPGAPASPVVAGPKPVPAVAVAVPSVPVGTAPSGSPTGPWAPPTGIGKRKSASSAPTGSAPAARHAVATPVAAVASLVAPRNRTRHQAPVAPLISSGSWRIQRVHAAPKTTSSLGPASTRGDIAAIEAILATAVAFGLGLLLFTTVRLRSIES